MVVKSSKISPNQLVAEILKALPYRTQDILKRRFGINKAQSETLESIGKTYKITRERVRQIEVHALSYLQKNMLDRDFQDFSKIAEEILEKKGGIMVADYYLKLLQEQFNQPVDSNTLMFLLRLDKKFIYLEENENFRALWVLEKIGIQKIYWLINKLIGELEKISQPLTLEQLWERAKKLMPNITEDILENYLYISKSIASNPFKEYGLSSWLTIEPRGARDRAYSIMRHTNTPLHFKEITRLINEGQNYQISNATSPALWSKPIQIQTIHNELIKDPRFVLIGRGIYALSEWGYEPGTVKDIIIQILKEAKKPLSKEEIIQRVKAKRMVKDNTILLNLQNKKLFKKTPNKLYILNKSVK